MKWGQHSSTSILTGLLKGKSRSGLTHGPTTLTETLTCTKWTGPLGLKQRRHRVNFHQMGKPPTLASHFPELPTSQERQPPSDAAFARAVPHQACICWPHASPKEGHSQVATPPGSCPASAYLPRPYDARNHCVSPTSGKSTCEKLPRSLSDPVCL